MNAPARRILPSSRFRLATFAVAALCVVFVPAVAVDGAVPTGVSRAGDLLPLEEVPLTLAPNVDLAAVAAEDAERELQGLPDAVRHPNPVRISPAEHGVWEQIDGGVALVWRLRVASPGARSLNLGFSRYNMPEGGRLDLYAPDYSRSIRAFTSRDNAAHGELWTPALRTDALVVEITIPADARDKLDLEMASLNVGYRGFGEEEIPESGSCNVDVVCPDGNGWRNEIPSVAVLQRSGGLVCTGFLVNNTALDERPYFMTARHCGVTSSNAATVVAYWNYETSTCGGFPDGTLDEFTSGSFWRSSHSPSDFTLVELDENPDPSFGVTFSGWDRSGDDATSAVAIHHPSVDEKRISFENDPTTTTSYLGSSAPGDGTHVRVADWDTGTTEGGSSGSPLYDQNHHVIGQLHGGYAACGNNSPDWYGKLSVSWEGGGTSSSRLRDWLDPGNTGVLALDTLVPGAGGCDQDGTCDLGEDCNTCPSDCIGGSGGSFCGNDVCEPSMGEDCLSCPSDCNGKQGGKPSNRYCCGDGAGEGPVGCEDPRCTGDGNTCGTGSGSYCCGDGVCEGPEDSFDCAVDCGPPSGCGAPGDSCLTGADCCSEKCKGASGKRTCR